MNVKADVIVKRENSQIDVEITNINATDMGIVIGKRGNTLDSIQYILNLFINKDRIDYMRVVVDVQGYRRKERTH